MTQLSFLPPAGPAPVEPLTEARIFGDAMFSPCGQYRWRLRRWWRAGRTVLWIMLNPSTADGTKNDPTLLRIIHFSKLWGFGGLIVGNLLPKITSDPAECRAWAYFDAAKCMTNWHAEPALADNDLHLEEMAAGVDMIVVAWGQGAQDEGRIEKVIEAVRSAAPDLPLYCVGRAQNGAPKHPMARGKHRIPNDQQPELWRAA